MKMIESSDAINAANAIKKTVRCTTGRNQSLRQSLSEGCRLLAIVFVIGEKGTRLKKNAGVSARIPAHTLTFRTDRMAIPIRNDMPAMPRLIAAISAKRR